MNGIAPGAVAGTEGLERLKDSKGSTSIEEYLPIHRLATVEDIASLTLFLVSDAASYITGQTIVVDGGQVLTTPNFTILYEHVRKAWKPNL